MAEANQKPKPLRKAYLALLAFSAVYLAAALACLRQWRAANPWARLDVFSGGLLVLGVLWTAADTRWHKAIFRSAETMKEASGSSYDPWLLRWIALLSLADLTVFLDYGHWHLVPALEQPALQAMGLGLYLLGALWLLWVDRYLSRHFLADPTARKVITGGPYHYVRHPRYAAVLSSRVAFALALASVLAWVFALIWLALILRRIRLEEAHLRELFGADYETYTLRTPRLLPRVY